jgi:nickel-dependent lactate racemase
MYKVPYGKTEIEFELLPDMKGTVIHSQPVEPLKNVPAYIDKVLLEPVNSIPLRNLAKKDDSVCIVFTDITRECPDYLLIPPILRELHAAGVRKEAITLLCGTGLHRASTYEERVVKLGLEIVENYRILDNEPQNSDALMNLGKTGNGTPIVVNKTAYEADLLISTGIVEPHQYAGYSGGRKTVAIGAAGEETIAYTHGVDMLDHPGARLGLIDGNPFHEAIAEAATRAKLQFIINVVIDDEKRPVAIYGGEPGATFDKLVTVAKKLYTASISGKYDIVIGGVGYPKDNNLYQASRAASYVFFAPTPVLKEDSVIIIPARCEEGAGKGIGEKRFYEDMHTCPNMSALLDKMRRQGCRPGAQRAFIMAKVMEKNPVVIVGSEFPDIVKETKMIPAPAMEDALKFATGYIGRPDLDVLIIPHVLLTLPSK